MTTTDTTPALDLDAIEARHAAATQGPWFWWGNTDSGNESLSGRESGIGVCEVLSTVEVEHKATDKRQIDSLVGSIIDADIVPSFLSDHDEWDEEWDERAKELHASLWRGRERFVYDSEDGDMRADVREALRRAATKEWVGDDDYGPRKTVKLALTTPDHWRKPVSEVAVYEVARAQGLPDDTPRDHDKVYRADICDVRNPNGQFLAASWSDVRDLLAEVKRLNARLERHKAALNVALFHAPDPECDTHEDRMAELDGCARVLRDEDEEAGA